MGVNQGTILLLSSFLFLSFQPLLYGQNQSYIVQLKEGESIESLGKYAQHAQLISKRLRAYRVTPTNNGRALISQSLEAIPSVHLVQPNRKLVNRGSKRPDDPLFDLQWNLERIGAPDLWDKTMGGITPCGDEIVIAVFDDGFDLDHQEFDGLIWTNKGEIANNGFDDDNNGYIDDYFGLNIESKNDRHEPDPEYHGPAVASVIAAKTDNGVGSAGLNWQVKLMIISSFEKDESIAIEAFDYILDQRKKYNESGGSEGAYVVAVNNSWGFEGGFEEQFPLLCEMFNTLGEAGILSVGATENDQVNTDAFGDIPSDCSSDFLIVVTNTDQDDQLGVAGFGRENVDLSAPGEAIQTVNRNNGNRSNGGTSFATPHVSGAIGLFYSLEEGTFCSDALTSPSEAALSMKRFILEGVTPLPSLQDRTVSGGRLNLKASADMITGTQDSSHPIALAIYPNPSVDKIFVNTVSGRSIDRFLIWDKLGREMLQGSGDKLSAGLPVQDLPAGTYFIQVTSQRNVAVGRFVCIGSH